MFIHKVTQTEVTKAFHDGNIDLGNELGRKLINQNKSPKYKKLYSWFVNHLPILDFFVAIVGIILAIIALLK